VYERLVRRFTAQTTDYQRLLSTFAEGLYTEMDFRNEALNASRMAALLAERCGKPRLGVPCSVPMLRRGCRSGARSSSHFSLSHVHPLLRRRPDCIRSRPCPHCRCSEFGATDLFIPQPLMELTTRRVLTMEWVTGVKLTTLEVRLAQRCSRSWL
jgi:predicted unusual protein kinase regulating ubiquinone biosynthesis (AarF/ABC1/UbiB family)